MAKYIVTGYFVQNISVTVEAEDEDDAMDKGWELLTDGEGIEGDGDWQDDVDVEELDEEEDK